MGVHVTAVNPDWAEDPHTIVATGQTVRYGDEVEVDADLAGRPPKGNPGDDDYDPGAGLLAQPTNWARSTTKVAAQAERKAK